MRHGSTAKRYSGDNRLIPPKSPYRRGCLAPRCRLVASWGWSRSQGSGCSPVKAARELGSERRETVRPLLSINSAICWELRVSDGTRSCHTRHMGWRHGQVKIRSVRTISREGWSPRVSGFVEEKRQRASGVIRRLIRGRVTTSSLGTQNPQRLYAEHLSSDG